MASIDTYLKYSEAVGQVPTVSRPAIESRTNEDLLAEKSDRSLIVLLDGVEDPQNLGAIVRTALAAGAQGVVIPERRAAGLTDSVSRASAGAAGIG